jgi:aryl-alcohol dehydrogenase-like predicted oxidoreductase
MIGCSSAPLAGFGWEISEIGYGMWGMAGWTGSDDEESRRSLDRAVAMGCNFFDTAWAYGEGRSEQLLGELVKRHPRQRLYTATKIPPKNRKWPARPEYPIERRLPRRTTSATTPRSVLRNLGLTTVDLQQFHVWDDSWATDRVWQRAVGRLKEGRPRQRHRHQHQPLAAEQRAEGARHRSHRLRPGRLQQCFDQAPEDELFVECERRNIAVIAACPFDEGSLTGTLTPDTTWPEGDFRNIYFQPENLKNTLERVDKLRPVVPVGMTMPELALRHILQHPAVSTVIPGMRKLRHVEQNLGASDGQPLRRLSWMS